MHKVIFNLAVFGSLLPSRPLRALTRPSRRVVLISLALLGVIAALFVGTGVKNALSPAGSHDFQWTPSKDVIDGVSPYRSFIEWDAKRESAATEGETQAAVPPHFLNQSPSYPASTYILLAPFAHLDWDTAKQAWLFANLIFIGLLLLGMQKVFPVANRSLLALLVLSFLIASPLRTSLGAGQHNLISLAAFIWAYYYARDGKNQTLAGILLAVAWIKYSLTFPLTLIFFRKNNYKPVLIATVIHTLLTCVAAWRIGMWPHEFFFHSVQVVLMGDGTGFLNLIAISMSLNLPLPVPLTVIAIVTVAIAAAVIRYREADELLVLAFLGLFSCAVFYHHGYDFVVLLLCSWALAQNKLEGAATTATAFLLAMAWVGQWLAKELSAVLGPSPALAADYLLISVFYCALFLIARAIYTTRQPLRAAALSF